jgi:hypothetical protein
MLCPSFSRYGPYRLQHPTTLVLLVPPSECSGDPEFDHATFMQYLKHHVITYKAQPARRHNKTGFVESGHSSIKLLARRLVLDSKSSTMHNRLPSFPELLSHATFLRNLLYGSRILSSFEQARGYQPSVADLPVGIITPALLQAYAEQIARRTLSRLLKEKDTSICSIIRFSNLGQP